MALGPTGVTTNTNDLVLNGDLVIRDANNVERIRLDRKSGGTRTATLFSTLSFPDRTCASAGTASMPTSFCSGATQHR
jgi:hypothetical protein